MEGNGDPSPSPSVPSQSTIRRLRTTWRTLLIANFVLAAYLFSLPRKKDRVKEKHCKHFSAANESVTSTPAIASRPPRNEPEIRSPVERAAMLRAPVPEYAQREIFKWILEEKRKVRPQNKEEKNRIDEEKALLKQFIRSESTPKIK